MVLSFHSDILEPIEIDSPVSRNANVYVATVVVHRESFQVHRRGKLNRVFGLGRKAKLDVRWHQYFANFSVSFKRFVTVSQRRIPRGGQQQRRAGGVNNSDDSSVRIYFQKKLNL